MLVSHGSWNKLPQTRRLKTTDSYSLSVLEVRNLKTRCVGMAVLPLKALGEDLPGLSQLPVAPGAPWLVDASLISAFMFTRPSSLCVSIPNPPLRSLTRLVIGFRGKGKPLQYSCLENSMDRGAW